MHGDRWNPFLRPCPPFAVAPSTRNTPTSRLWGQAGRFSLPSCLLTSEGSDVTMKWGRGALALWYGSARISCSPCFRRGWGAQLAGTVTGVLLPRSSRQHFSRPSKLKDAARRVNLSKTQKKSETVRSLLLTVTSVQTLNSSRHYREIICNIPRC